MDAAELEALGLEKGDTLTVRGDGGAVFEVDVPAPGTVQRELFDGHLLAGRYAILSDDEVKGLDGDVKATLSSAVGVEPKPKRRTPRTTPEPTDEG